MRLRCRFERMGRDRDVTRAPRICRARHRDRIERTHTRFPGAL